MDQSDSTTQVSEQIRMDQSDAATQNLPVKRHSLSEIVVGRGTGDSC